MQQVRAKIGLNTIRIHIPTSSTSITTCQLLINTVPLDLLRSTSSPLRHLPPLPRLLQLYDENDDDGRALRWPRREACSEWVPCYVEAMGERMDIASCFLHDHVVNVCCFLHQTPRIDLHFQPDLRVCLLCAFEQWDRGHCRLGPIRFGPEDSTSIPAP